jgi:hypothetical protein
MVMVGYENFTANQDSIPNHYRLDGAYVHIVVDAHMFSKTDKFSSCTLVAQSIYTEASACCQVATEVDPPSASNMCRPVNYARPGEQQTSLYEIEGQRDYSSNAVFPKQGFDGNDHFACSAIIALDNLGLRELRPFTAYKTMKKNCSGLK